MSVYVPSELWRDKPTTARVIVNLCGNNQAAADRMIRQFIPDWIGDYDPDAYANVRARGVADMATCSAYTLRESGVRSSITHAKSLQHDANVYA